MFNPDGSLQDRPKRIAVEYNYGGIGSIQFDEDIVRRICFDFDRKFVPVAKREVYRYSTGGTEVFDHFGFGVAHEPGLPVIDPKVYGAPKPFFGFLSKLDRALGVSVWAQGPPFAPALPEDGTPGVTVPFDERAYRYARDCHEEMRRLAAKAASGDADEIDGVPDELRQMATKAVRAQFKEAQAEHEKRVDAEEQDMRDFMVDGRKRLRSYFELSEYDRQGIALAMAESHNPTNAVKFAFSPSVRRAAPGSRLVVPN